MASMADADVNARANAGRKRRKPRSLLLLLKSLMGLRVRVDLKNDVVLEGVVQEVVRDMDLTMLDACETKPNGTRTRLDEVFVMGKTVLFVHIPDRVNVSQHLQQYTRMIRQSAKMYSRSKRAAPPPAPSRASPLLPRPSG